MAVPMIPVNDKCRFSDYVAEFHYVFHIPCSLVLRFLRFLAAEILIRRLGREKAQKTQEKQVLRMARFCVFCAFLRLDCCG